MLFVAFGYLRPPRHAHGTRSGGWEPAAWVASAIVKKPTFSGVCKMSARSCQPPLRPVTAGKRPERASLTGDPWPGERPGPTHKKEGDEGVKDQLTGRGS